MASKKDSFWYPRYYNDYERATSHLSIIEHGVYNLLLDQLYRVQKPLLANAKAIARQIRCQSQEEIDALQNVLDQFFVLTDSGWCNKRAEKEIGLRNKRIDNNRKSARLGGISKKKNMVTIASECSSECSSESPTYPITNNPYPITNKDKEDLVLYSNKKLDENIFPSTVEEFKELTSVQVSSSLIKKKEPFCLTADLIQWGRSQQNKWTEVEMWLHFEYFDNYLANKSGKPYKDLKRAFRNAVIGNWAKLRTHQSGGMKTAAQLREERSQAALDRNSKTREVIDHEGSADGPAVEEHICFFPKRTG